MYLFRWSAKIASSIMGAVKRKKRSASIPPARTAVMLPSLLFDGPRHLLARFQPQPLTTGVVASK